MNAWDFQPIDSTTTYAYEPSPFGLYHTGGLPWLLAPVHLPAGAVVSVLEINACDTNAGDDLHVYFDSVTRAGVYDNPGGFIGATTTGSGGCQSAQASSFTPFTIDNNNLTYMLEISFNVNDSSLKIISVRVGYKLQVSPGPATATFGDVSNAHPFYKFIEALAASGITGGCGGGNFCPNAPITRGEMAVFLAGALGLHWAP